MMNLKNISLSITLLITVNCSYAQLNAKNLLTYKIIVNYEDHNIIAYVKPAGNIPLDNDRTYYWFSGHEIKTTQGNYSGKLLNGSYADFYTNKNLKESGWFSKGLKYGLWKKWNELGSLIEETNWSEGLKNGSYHRYNEQGSLIETGKYKNDLLSGDQTIKIGDSTQVKFFRKGKEATRKSIVPKFLTHFFSGKNNKKP